MWREEKEVGGFDDETNQDGEAANEKSVLKVHWTFKLTGLIATCTHTSLDFVFGSVFGRNLQLIMGQFITIIFLFALFSNPRSFKRTYNHVLFASFAVLEVFYAISAIREEGNTAYCFKHIIRLGVWIVFYLFALRFLRNVAFLSDVEISNFLMKSLLKNLIGNGTGMLFVTFKDTNSSLKNGNVPLQSVSLISICFVIVNVRNVISGGRPKRLIRAQYLSWEKNATMRGVLLNEKFESFFLTCTILCGMFLFCCMEATDNLQLVTTVGYVGPVTAISIIVIEVIAFFRENTEQSEEQETEPEEEIICHSIRKLGASFVLTSLYILSNIS